MLPAVNPIFYSFFARDFKNRISQIGKHLASFKSKIANPLMLTPLLPNKPVLTQEGTKFILVWIENISLFVPVLKHMNTSRVNTTIINPTVTSNLPPNDTNNRSEQSIVQWSLFLFLLINYNLFYLFHCTFEYRVFNSFLVKNRFCEFGNIDWLASSPRMFACFSQNWYS